MGTNYYARYNACDCCGRYDEAHIGKSMRTVQAFDGLESFRPIPGYDDPMIVRFADWRLILGFPHVSVWNEYGDLVALGGSPEMRIWLDAWERYDGADDWQRRDRYASTYRAHGDWLDDDGYHMSMVDRMTDDSHLVIVSALAADLEHMCEERREQLDNVRALPPPIPGTHESDGCVRALTYFIDGESGATYMRAREWSHHHPARVQHAPEAATRWARILANPENGR
jgi:hypothetical protein